MSGQYVYLIALQPIGHQGLFEVKHHAEWLKPGGGEAM